MAESPKLLHARFRHGLVNSAMGQIPCSTERISSYDYDHTRPASTATNLEQVDNLLSAHVNSASYSQRDEECSATGTKGRYGSCLCDPVYNTRFHGLLKIVTISKKK